MFAKARDMPGPDTQGTESAGLDQSSGSAQTGADHADNSLLPGNLEETEVNRQDQKVPVRPNALPPDLSRSQVSDLQAPSPGRTL